jgi:hypothetical protein
MKRQHLNRLFSKLTQGVRAEALQVSGEAGPAEA